MESHDDPTGDPQGSEASVFGGAGRSRPPTRRFSRRWLATVTGLFVVVAGAEAAWLVHSRHSGSGSIAHVTQVAGSTQQDSHYPGATLLPRAVAKPTVTLTDTSGRPYDLATATAGRVTLVYFGYTHCPDVCPINMALTAAALRQMPAGLRGRVTVVFVTTDPARDTPPVIRAWLDHFDASFVGLTGTIAQIHQAEQQVGMPLSFVDTADSGTNGYQVSHAGYTLLYSQDDQAQLSVDDTETVSSYAATLEHLVQKGFQA